MSPRRKRLIRIIGIAVVVVILLAVFLFWFAHRNQVSTDDAFVDGTAVIIAPQVAGDVIKLAVTDNQFVRAGQLLFEIDPRPFADARDQAEAALKQAQLRLRASQLGALVAHKNFPARLSEARGALSAAEANLKKASDDYDREIALAPASRTGQELDAATAALRSAQAQVEQARAQVQAAMPVPQNIGQAEADVSALDAGLRAAEAELNDAELKLGWAEVRAPQDGWVTKRSVELGSYFQPGQEALALVSPQVWITANFKEGDLARIHRGEPVDIRIDAYPELKLSGHIDSVQLGSGSRFSAFPPENATGNYVKIVQRIPVKIVIDRGLDPKHPLPLGASAVPTVRVD